MLFLLVLLGSSQSTGVSVDTTADHYYDLTNSLPASPKLDQTTKRVIIITVDGLKADFLNDTSLPELPTIEWIVREGTIAKGMLMPNPTLTATGHVSIGAGANSSVHGIMGNTFYDWEDNYTYSFFADPSDPYRNTTIGANLLLAPQGFHWAEMQGRKSAAIGWPYSDGKFNKTIEPFVNLPYSQISSDNNQKIAERIVKALTDNPDVELLYARFPGVDSASHHGGLYSEAYYDALKNVDDALRIMFQGLNDSGLLKSTTVMIMGDHGFAETEDSSFFLEEQSLFKEAISATGLSPIIAHDAGFAYLYFPKEQNKTKAQVFADYLKQIPEVDEVFVNEENAKIGMYNPLRGMNISVWYYPNISRNFGSPFDGMHGYLNKNPQMRSALLMIGPEILANQTIDVVKAIDITPTALDILGIDPMPTAQGSPLTGIFRETPKEISYPDMYPPIIRSVTITPESPKGGENVTALIVAEEYSGIDFERSKVEISVNGTFARDVAVSPGTPALTADLGSFEGPSSVTIKVTLFDQTGKSSEATKQFSVLPGDNNVEKEGGGFLPGLTWTLLIFSFMTIAILRRKKP